jgi:hypothetical protein
VIGEKAMKYDGFHDAGVSQFHLEKGTLNVKLECYNEKNNGYDPVTFIFLNVSDLQIDGRDTTIFEAIYDDGEMLDFSVEDTSAKFLIEWIDYKTKGKCTKAYSFKFEKVEVVDSREEKGDTL